MIRNNLKCSHLQFPRAHDNIFKVWFCPTNRPMPQSVQFTMMQKGDKQLIPTLEELK